MLEKLKKLKELLDLGAINQEEFDTKKEEYVWGGSLEVISIG